MPHCTRYTPLIRLIRQSKILPLSPNGDAMTTAVPKFVRSAGELNDSVDCDVLTSMEELEDEGVFCGPLTVNGPSDREQSFERDMSETCSARVAAADV